MQNDDNNSLFVLCQVSSCLWFFLSGTKTKAWYLPLVGLSTCHTIDQLDYWTVSPLSDQQWVWPLNCQTIKQTLQVRYYYPHNHTWVQELTSLYVLKLNQLSHWEIFLGLFLSHLLYQSAPVWPWMLWYRLLLRLQLNTWGVSSWDFFGEGLEKNWKLHRIKQ